MVAAGSVVGWMMGNGVMPSVDDDKALLVPTLEDGGGRAKHVASPGDWIIRGVAGEFYPCKPDIFEQTYEPVEG